MNCVVGERFRTTVPSLTIVDRCNDAFETVRGVFAVLFSDRGVFVGLVVAGDDAGIVAGDFAEGDGC